MIAWFEAIILVHLQFPFLACERMIEFHCKGIIFDLDGVLVDSDAVFDKHWRIWAAERGVSFEDIAAVHHGIPAINTVSIVAPHLDAAREAKILEGMAAGDMNGHLAYPGAHELLADLPEGKWAIATSSPKELALPRLNHLKLPVPQVLVTIDDVARGKPAPDPYLEAARQLAIPAEDCLVIEDAPAGIQAALMAGARVIAVTTTNPKDRLLDAFEVVASIKEIAITAINSGFSVSIKQGLNAADV